MTKKEFLLKAIYENISINASTLVDKYYEECEDDIEEKRRYYIGEGIEKTEKELKNQIRAEFQAEPYHKWNKGFKYIKLEKVEKFQNYLLTDEGKEFYEENYLDIENSKENLEIVNEIADELNNEEDIDNGLVYLLKSKTYEHTYKIGITKLTINERLTNLKRDIRYGVFDLTPIMYIKSSDYKILERVFHKFFENFRLCKKNALLVDTELFKDLDTIETEFELFANFLKANPRYKNSVELVKI